MYNGSFLIHFDNIWKKMEGKYKYIRNKQSIGMKEKKMAEERKCRKEENLGEIFKILFYIFCLKSGLSVKPFGNH